MSRDMRVSTNQSLFDIAIQKCGSIEAVFGIAILNGLSVTDSLGAGLVVMIPDELDKPVVDYYKTRGLNPGTSGDGVEILDRIFSEEFPLEFS